MTCAALIAAAAWALLLARAAGQITLNRLNRASVLEHAAAVPAAFQGMVDEKGYRKSVSYALAKSRLGLAEIIWDAAVLAAILFSGVLPWIFNIFLEGWGPSSWPMAAFIFSVALLLAALNLPLEWHEQFRLEEKFGFNTASLALWITDRVKGLVLLLVLGLPLLALILKIVDWAGAWWWLWAWAAMMGFQLLLLVLAPSFILPWFNKFTPLPEGPLRERLLALGARTGFQARSIQVMDGSKRSRHSNAFFTGFGRFRKIVLFDTLMQQLSEEELEAVLAHEIGHYKRKHIPKMLAWSACSLLAGFGAAAGLARWDCFYEAFGFAPGSGIAPALLLFVLLSGMVTFWLSPVMNYWSRKFEYEADAYAAAAGQGAAPLIQALRKLNTKNLSNLTPHPLYSAFYYSHPTLLEREGALAAPAA